MTATETRNVLIALALLALAACLPFAGSSYWLAKGVSIAMFTVLATSWALFSGPTHYISLATAAFFGVGTYTTGLGIDHLPYWALLPVAGVLGAVLAALVGGDLGPRLLPIGSLAGLLWLDLLRRGGVRIGLRRFVTVGLLVTAPTLAVALAILSLL